MIASTIAYISPVHISRASAGKPPPIGSHTTRPCKSRAGRCRPRRRISAPSRIGLRSAAGLCRPAIPHFSVRLEELAIVRGLEIEQGSSRLEVLNKGLADSIGGARREGRHHNCGYGRSEHWHTLQQAGGTSRTARRNCRSRQARDE